MEKKIFRSIIIVAFCVLVISMIFIMQVLYTHVEKNISDELEENGNFIGAAVENEGLDYLENLKESDVRITYINKKGKVLYDNRTDFHKMGNHKNRKEVKEALIILLKSSLLLNANTLLLSGTIPSVNRSTTALLYDNTSYLVSIIRIPSFIFSVIVINSACFCFASLICRCN